MTRNYFRSLSVLLLLALAASAAYAAVILSPARTWSSAPNYIIDDRGHAQITDINGGATATRNAVVSSVGWNSAGAGRVITATVGSVAGFTLGDGIPMLNFSDPIGVCSGSCIMASFTGFYSAGTIYDADIVTNPSAPFTSELEDPGGAGCSGEFYVESISTHEFGHVLGLGHCPVSGSTMYPSVSTCNNAVASIEPADMDGILQLYGRPGSCAGSCGGSGPGCWCDSLCHQFGDCCHDKISLCGYP